MRNPEQAREARARRKAQREGLALQKSRTRNPGILDWGTYMLVDPDHNRVVAGPGMSLSEVEAALND
jgi:FAD/FMN-containing dehydrogenase